ncbi:hypothetical protein [Thermoflexus sp.]|uniref:hypothetical protein n=1 Tax=Thermoflexus sp. TaxID=1969742 RepID=UPI0035E4375F
MKQLLNQKALGGGGGTDRRADPQTGGGVGIAPAVLRSGSAPSRLGPERPNATGRRR